MHQNSIVKVKSSFFLMLDFLLSFILTQEQHKFT